MTIVLATANARYAHTALGLRYLLANLGELENHAVLMEFTIHEHPSDIAEKILAAHPKIIGLSVFLWNTVLLTEVVTILKKIREDVVIVIGGPEVSFELDSQHIVDLADYVVVGAGEFVFYTLCRDILAGIRPVQKICSGKTDELSKVALPYRLYDEKDIANRVLYLEASRGCPFKCEFCLSSLDSKVRKFPVEQMFFEIEQLWNRGARKFKFVDRALHLAISTELLQFFLERSSKGAFVHFELVPDNLPEPLFDVLRCFPPGAVQLEAGVQTLNPKVAERIGRKQNSKRVLETLRRLRVQTGVHLHTDLVVGLPGETLESFAEGFDLLMATGPQEIQVGILKRLRGAPICRHDTQWQMVYNDRPPYEILRNSHLDFPTTQRLKRLSRYFDLIYNSGNFISFCNLLCRDGSAFMRFLDVTDWLYSETNRTHSIALHRLADCLFEYATIKSLARKEVVANHLYADFTRLGRRSFPDRVRKYVTELTHPQGVEGGSDLPPRQYRKSKLV